MLLSVVPEIRDRGVGACYEDCVDTVESAADLAEKLVLCADFAVMLTRVVTTGADFLRLEVLCIEP